MSKRQSSIMFIVSLVISGMIFLQMGLYVISMLAGWNVRFNLVASLSQLDESNRIVIS